MIDMEADRLLKWAMYNALDEIVTRGIERGRAVERCDPLQKYDALHSVFDAIDAYYVARRAAEVNSDLP